MLSGKEQYNLLWDIGTFVDSFKDGNIVYQLYAINDFFVEVAYNQPENKIVDKKVFKQGERLEKYLPK
jgi:hypothetical protein